MSKPGANLAAKPRPDQIEELDRLVTYLRNASESYRLAGDRGLAQSLGITARRVAGHVLAIRERIDLESSCCSRRVIRGSCDCAAGAP